MARYGLGIELGMTSIAVAVADGTSVQVVPASADTASPEVPAVVYAAHGHFATGADAARRAIGSPDRLATGVLGSVATRTPVVIDGTGYPPEAVLGTMVHNVLTHVADIRGEPPQRVTVTHPTHWAADEVAALLDAVRPVLPGGGALQLVPNLIAAAMHHASTSSQAMSDGDAVAIVDVGATAFEAALIGRCGDQVVLLSPQVERGAVGGDHLDAAVLEYVDHVTDGAVSALDMKSLQGQITLARLRRDCRVAKETLSTARSVDLTAYLPTGTTTVRLSRTALEEAIRPQVDILIGAVVRALRSGPDVRPRSLVLTGGSAQLPLLQQLTAAIKGVPEVRTVRHAAARGAAALAAVPASPAAPATAPADGQTGGSPAGGDEESAGPPGDDPDPEPNGSDTAASASPADPASSATPPAPDELAQAGPGHNPSELWPGPAASPDQRPDGPGPGGHVFDSLEPQLLSDPAGQQAAGHADGGADSGTAGGSASSAADGSAPGLSITAATAAVGQPGARIDNGAEPDGESVSATRVGALPPTPSRPLPPGVTAVTVSEELSAARLVAADVGVPWPQTGTAVEDRSAQAWPTGGWPGGGWPGEDAADQGSQGREARSQVADGGGPGGLAEPGLDEPDDRWPQPPSATRSAASAGRGRAWVAVAAVVAVASLILAVVYVVIERPWNAAGSVSAPVGVPAATAAPSVTTVVVAPPPAATTPAAGGPAVSADTATSTALIRAGTTPGFAAISPSGRQVYIANRTGGRPSGGLLTVVDTATDSVSDQIEIPQGPAQYLSFAPDGKRLYVSIFSESGRGPNKVDVVDTTSNTITASIDVGTRPFALAVTPDGSQVWVPNHDSGTVSVIDTATNRLITDIRVPANPHWVAFSPDGRRAYTANHESNLIAVLDTTSRSVVAQVPVGVSPHSVAVHPTEPLVANVNYDGDSVSLIDTATEDVVGTTPGCRAGCTSVKVGHHPQDLAFSPDGRHLYVTNVEDHTVSVVNLDKRTVSATVPVGTSPTSITVTADGAKAYVTNLDDGTVSVLKLTG